MAVDQAVVLAAGAGSRLRSVAASKPLCPVAGQPLLAHCLRRLAHAGIARAVVVTGYLAGEVESYLADGEWPVEVSVARSADWTLPNGVSALAAASAVADGPTLLVMSDHLVDPELYRSVARAGAGEGLRLGIDRRLDHAWIDLDDVTRVALDGDRIAAIGKGIDRFDAYDTGVFAVGPAFFAALAAIDAPSLSAGVSVLAARGQAGTVDVSGLDWLDVDDPRALAIAEQWCAGLHPRVRSA